MVAGQHGKKGYFKVSEKQVLNLIAGEAKPAHTGQYFDKHSPHDGRLLWQVARSNAQDILAAVQIAHVAQPVWAATPAVQRGAMLYRACAILEAERERIAEVVAVETGKSRKDALGETDGAIALGRFFAGEGQRLYGRTTTSGMVNRHAMTVRQPCGVAALIAAANTPIANIAWKVFPALICGNAAVIKAAEDTPMTAFVFAEALLRGDVPPGVLNVVQGLGQEAGAPLIETAEVDVISFTGSTAVGRWIGEVAGRRLIKVSLELGGKNPFVVCDDADLDNAVHWACLSAFSNAGQRCAAGSRILVFDAVYEEFVRRMVDATSRLRLGPGDGDDLGPVINGKQMDRMLSSVETARANGARILCGGHRLMDPSHANGFYMAPTLIDQVDPASEISTHELFGPISTLYRVRDFAEALRMSNDSHYGLTAAIHTANIDRAMQFVHGVRAGVAIVNAGTYGSEPHMPFGGVKQSGNGSREPGTEAVDVYTELKDIYINVLPNRV
jgi:aldehyde dehydrogenase (NAD+)